MNTYKQIKNGGMEYNNWRYLRNQRNVSPINYTGGQIDLCKDEKRLDALLGNYYNVSFSNMSILKYVNLDNKQFKGLTISMTFDSSYPEYCKMCYGAGKFDWISNITGPDFFNSKYEFIRDKSVVLLYHKPNKEISKNHIWAPTKVYEGERICDNCLGTGIDLLRTGINLNINLKLNLVLYDIRYLLT